MAHGTRRMAHGAWGCHFLKLLVPFLCCRLRLVLRRWSRSSSRRPRWASARSRTPRRCATRSPRPTGGGARAPTSSCGRRQGMGGGSGIKPDARASAGQTGGWWGTLRLASVSPSQIIHLPGGVGRSSIPGRGSGRGWWGKGDLGRGDSAGGVGGASGTLGGIRGLAAWTCCWVVAWTCRWGCRGGVGGELGGCAPEGAGASGGVGNSGAPPPRVGGVAWEHGNSWPTAPSSSGYVSLLPIFPS